MKNDFKFLYHFFIMPCFILHFFITCTDAFTFLSLRVQAALPKELPASPAKFLTDACLTRSEDLWITAEGGGVYRLSGQEMKPKWEDMRKQPGVFFEKNRNSCRFYEKETFFICGLFFIHSIRKDLS